MKKTSLKIKHILLLGVLTWNFSCSTDERLELEALNSSERINSVTQAEDYDAQSGVQIVDNSRVGFIENGDYIRFDDIEYQGATGISIQAGSRSTAPGVTPTSTAVILNGGAEMFIYRNGFDTNGTSSIDAVGTEIDNDQDNADAFDMTPPSTVILNSGEVIDSPFRALWNNTELNGFIEDTISTANEGPAVTTNANTGAFAFSLNNPQRRLYQRVEVEEGVEYSITFYANVAEGAELVFRVLDTEITSESDDIFAATTISEPLTVSGTENGGVYQKYTVEFTATTSSAVIYGMPTLDSDANIMIDDISIDTRVPSVGTIEVRTGSPAGDLLGSVRVTNTGGFSRFETFTAELDTDSDNSDFYLVFVGGEGFLFDVDSFILTDDDFVPESTVTPVFTNIALDGIATQSSTAFGAPATRAIDGNTNGSFGGASVTHTENMSQPWWQVEFDGDQNIGDIVIWNRTDRCCVSRLTNFNVTVLTASGNTAFDRTFADAPNPSLTISTGGIVGSRVIVRLNDVNPLSLAEVQVFSDSATVPVEVPVEVPVVVTPPEGEITLFGFGLSPDLEPWENFDLSVWSLDSPAPRPEDECRATRIDEDEWDDVPGSPTRPYFFSHTDGGMRFVSPVGGATTSRSCDSGFPRTELREMLRAGDRSVSTTGVNANNWALGYQPPNPDHGGRNGVLTATLIVDRVTTTGDGLHPGRTIIGQIHAKDDEPARLYYRKCPDNEYGSIYLEHEIRDVGDVTFNLMGSENCSDNPSNGFRLGELFSYEIINEGQFISVYIYDGDIEGQDRADAVASTMVNMTTVQRTNGGVTFVGSGYDKPTEEDGELEDEWMYFKAGAYTQNNTGDSDDTDIITFYRLSNTHDVNDN